MSPLRLLRHLVLGLTLVVVLAAGAGAPAAAEPWRPAAATVTVVARAVPAEPAIGIAPDEADDRDDPSWGWGPSRLIWAGFGWLGLVLVSAILLRRRASRRR